MSWSIKALTLGLGLFAGSSATEALDAEWFSPVAGILRVYTLNDDPLAEPPRAADSVHPVQSARSVHSVLPSVNSRRLKGRRHPVSLLSLSEESVETRVHVDGATDAVGHQGAIGSGKSDAVVTMTGSNANAKRLMLNATTGNALVANSVAAAKAAANAHVNATVNGTGAGTGHVAVKTPIAAIGWLAWLRVTMSMGFMVKTMCMMSNIFYQASPLPLISEFQAKGDTGEADLAPFIATAYSGWQWCFYGTFACVVTGKTGFLVLVYSNVVGATFGLYYVYAFLTCCKNKAMLDKSTMYYYVLGAIVGAQFIAIMTLPPVRSLFFSGLISSAWSTITSCSLLVTLPLVWETKNSKSLPLPLLLMGVVSATLWVVCGVMLWDPWISFPNMFALVVCGYALTLCWRYPPTEMASPCLAERIHRCASEPDCSMGEAEYAQQSVLASPLQRALGYVTRSPHIGESQALQESMEEAVRYDTCGGTGGTGETF